MCMIMHVCYGVIVHVYDHACVLWSDRTCV